MLFAVIFTDKPDHAEVRAANLQAHIDWLESHRDVIPVGGSLRHEPGQTPKGGLWVANADSKAQLETLLKTDPFYTAGLRQSYEILHWSKANGERQALI
ncbi:YciI family protein [Paucibacter sp. Y2R2-4]|uniref:YciI family protein n=1 Tax=Paucibacter sp. Y2R2-4 TaxID=2893553 RepID=UPI0021E3877C|nr:YciI family protein [Paucibacter sp. Y2R2-4]MCV2349916.1 YciI family protein [Paucibacter sp. Y2R2-4]